MKEKCFNNRRCLMSLLSQKKKEQERVLSFTKIEEEKQQEEEKTNRERERGLGGERRGEDEGGVLGRDKSGIIRG